MTNLRTTSFGTAEKQGDNEYEILPKVKTKATLNEKPSHIPALPPEKVLTNQSLNQTLTCAKRQVTANSTIKLGVNLAFKVFEQNMTYHQIPYRSESQRVHKTMQN